MVFSFSHVRVYLILIWTFPFLSYVLVIFSMLSSYIYIHTYLSCRLNLVLFSLSCSTCTWFVFFNKTQLTFTNAKTYHVYSWYSHCCNKCVSIEKVKWNEFDSSWKYGEKGRLIPRIVYRLGAYEIFDISFKVYFTNNGKKMVYLHICSDFYISLIASKFDKHFHTIIHHHKSCSL